MDASPVRERQPASAHHEASVTTDAGGGGGRDWVGTAYSTDL